jgi:hypothetical protein
VLQVEFRNTVDIQLLYGLEQGGSVALGAYVNYSFFIPDSTPPSSTLAVWMTRLTGDPNLYGSFNNTDPRIGIAQYSSASTGSDVLRVTLPETAPGRWFFISVYGYQASTYSIVVRFEPTTTGYDCRDKVLTKFDRYLLSCRLL